MIRHLLTDSQAILAALVAWLGLSVPFALIIGKMIDLGDEEFDGPA